MTLHRWVDPTYDLGTGGSFPGTVFGETYDRINIGTAGAGGTPADAAKIGGNFPGTYLVDFEEDATASNTNRGMRALTENSDHLDDLLHRDLVEIIRSANVVSAGDASTTLDGSTQEIFVGNAGAAAATTFAVVNSLDGPILDPATGAIIIVSSIGGATIGTGYTAANPLTLTFNITIPSGITYRIVHGRRTNPGAQNDELVAETGLVSGISLIGTVQELVRGGLDGRYRNATNVAAAALDTAGAGGTITRDGPAVTVDVDDATDLFADPIGGCFKVFSTVNTTGYSSGDATGLGFVQYIGNRFTADTLERGPDTSIGAFAAVWPHDITGTIASVRTQIVSDGSRTGLLNPGGGNTDVVELNVLDFFYNGSTESAVNVGFDLLEVTRAAGDVEVYVITELDMGNSRRADVRDLSGVSPNFSTTDEIVTFRWLTTHFWQGPPRGLHESDQNGPFGFPARLGGLIHQVPPLLGSASDITDNSPAIFGARDDTGARDALIWAGFDTTVASGLSGMSAAIADATRRGRLIGDGGIETAGVSLLGLYLQKTQTMVVTATGTQTWALGDTPRLVIDAQTNAQTLTIDLTGYLAGEGHRCEIIVNLAAGVSTFTIIWPGLPVFAFSSAGDKVPTQGALSRTVYRGTFTNAGAAPNHYLMAKFSYPAGGVLSP